MVYVNLFNNQWTTNFRFWNSGTWTYRVRLWSIATYEPAPDLITPSLEARYPLLAAATDGRADHFQDVQVETIDGAGHWAHHDQLDTFLNLTRTFLAD